MSQTGKIFKLYDQSVIIPLDEYDSSVEDFNFQVFTGSRVVSSLFVKTIQPGSSLKIEVMNSFSVDGIATWEKLGEFNVTESGHFKKIFTNFNRFFQFKVTVVGDPIEFVVAINIFDNSSETELTDAIGIGELIPKKFNKFQVISRNLDGDPTAIQYFSQNVSVGTLSLSYNLEGDIDGGEFV